MPLVEWVQLLDVLNAVFYYVLVGSQRVLLGIRSEVNRFFTEHGGP